MDWFDNVWEAFAMFVLVLIIMLIGCVLVTPKNVDYYYVTQGTETGTCVESHWTWHPDERAFCTNNYNEALDFMTKANAALPKH